MIPEYYLINSLLKWWNAIGDVLHHECGAWTEGFLIDWGKSCPEHWRWLAEIFGVEVYTGNVAFLNMECRWSFFFFKLIIKKHNKEEKKFIVHRETWLAEMFVMIVEYDWLKYLSCQVTIPIAAQLIYIFLYRIFFFFVHFEFNSGPLNRIGRKFSSFTFQL